MICNACMCSGKFNVLTVFLPTFSRADINNIFSVIMRVSHHGNLQLGHVGWVKVLRLTVSISGKTRGKLRENSGNFEMDSLWVPCPKFMNMKNYRIIEITNISWGSIGQGGKYREIPPGISRTTLSI